MRILVISDIHFGKKDPKITYKMLDEVFIKYCEDNKPDLIIIAGDLFDKRFGLHSDVSENVNKFMGKLVKFIENNNSTLYIIHGTLSHDHYQLKTFKHYLVNPNIRIFETVEGVEFNGYKILIMPEEYVTFNYYDEYLSKQWDFVFGHGMFDFATVIIKSDKKLKQEVLNSKKLSHSVKYGVFFGHVHTSQNHNKVMYTGSFDRLNFGEEEDKGFVDIFVDDKNYNVKFIKNPMAQTYTTINAKDIPEDLEKSLEYMRNFKESNDYLRIVIDSEITENKLNNIIGFERNNDNVTILKKIIGVKKDEETKTEIDKVTLELMNKLKDFENLNFIEITKKIAKDDYGIEFTTDEILDIIESDKK